MYPSPAEKRTRAWIPLHPWPDREENRPKHPDEKKTTIPPLHASVVSAVAGVDHDDPCMIRERSAASRIHPPKLLLPTIIPIDVSSSSNNNSRIINPN